MNSAVEPNAASFAHYDAIVVGGGLAGTLAAIVLARQGYRLMLVDPHTQVPFQFRVEKIAGDQVEKFQRLDLIEMLQSQATGFDTIVNARHGRILGRTHQTNYSILYNDLVNGMRAAVPDTVDVHVGRVTDIATAQAIQSVAVSGIGTLKTRLVVLATGIGDALRRKLGVTRRVVHEKQSLTFGFDIAAAGSEPLRYPALTYNGDRPSEAVDYLSLFPLGQKTRANLFTFLALDDPRTAEFREAPKKALIRALPGLVDVLGDFVVTGKVEAWPVDLSVVENSRHAGVVLIGDAFQTSCPAAGTGVSRILTDVERLCTVHAPAWLDNEDCSAASIAQFYDDPEKQDMDQRALFMAHYRRSFTIDTGIGWRMRRQVSYAKRRFVGLLDRLDPAAVARLRRMLSHSA